jgi:hypothetical protein
MESVDLDVNQFFKAMESVFGEGSQEQAGSDDGFDRKSSSSDMDFGICFFSNVIQEPFFYLCYTVSYQCWLFPEMVISVGSSHMVKILSPF